jgi:hypothetical protein
MRSLFTLSFIVGTFAIGSAQNYGTGSNPDDHYVSGYTNKRGTYVEPHYQTNPNSDLHDNYGARGNSNYQNGQTGRGY